MTAPLGYPPTPDFETSVRARGEATTPGTRKFLWKLGLSLVLAALFCWLLTRGGVPLIPSSEDFAEVRWWSGPAYGILLLFTHVFRASRWRFLIAPIQPIRLREALLLNWISFLAIFVLPMRLGEVVRPTLTKLRHGVAMAAGIGTVAVERIVDGLLTSLAVVWALAMVARRESDDKLARALPYYGYLAAGAFAAGFVLLLLFLWQRPLAMRGIQFAFARVSPRIGHRIAHTVAGLADGVRSIAVPRLAGGFLFETALYWVLNAIGMWVLALGCGLDMSFSQAIAVLGILSIGILLPAGPGLFGNFQLALSLGLKLYFADAIVATNGAVFIFLMYTIQVVVHLATGVPPLYTAQLSLRSLFNRPAKVSFHGRGRN